MSKTFVIAEAGVNHNGSLSLAKELIDIAVNAGADAVKFQTFSTDQLVTKNAKKAEYQLKQTLETESQYAMLKKLELSFEAHQSLLDYCNTQHIQFLSSPFDQQSLDFLVNQLNLPMIKLGSGEISNALLLLKTAHAKKRVILSTGMSTLGEIETALSILAFGYLSQDEKAHHASFMNAYSSTAGQQMLKEYVTLLHCTTEYPAPFNEVNLKAMDTLRNTFQLSVGYSDHSEGIEIALAAVARGATMIEKHITTDRRLPGPDHLASLEPHDLEAMIAAIRHIEVAIGDGYKLPAKTEFKNRAIARKSLVALQPISKGEVFNEQNLGTKRPNEGISAIHYWDWLGKIAERDYQEDEMIK